MQSYKIHSVSEHLQDRYPYLEIPFNERLDPSDVYDAVFDRAIPKLVEILLMEDIEHYKYRDAFITLNEQVSHQETKDSMITQGLVSIASAYLQHKVVEIRREAVLLLGSLCSIKRGRDFLSELSFQGLKEMINDENINAREACCWTICRILTGRDGVDLFVESKLISTIIQAFLSYTEPKRSKQDAKGVIMLLESFVNVLQYDNGIEFFVGTGIIARLNDILKNSSNEYFDKQWCLRINFLSLDCLAKIILNEAGRQESIDIKVIDTASKYLDSKELKEIQYSIILIMNSTIHLKGKQQCTYVKDDYIIIKLIDLFIGNTSQQLEDFMIKDVQQALINIAELPDGFLAITKKLANNTEKLNEVFGPNVIKALSNLLPKTSELEEPPILDETKVDEYKIYAKSICEFILRGQDNEALLIAIEDIVKIVEKLVVFLMYNSLEDQDLYAMITSCLIKICQEDEQSLDTLQRYLKEYGDIIHPITQTSLNAEIENNKFKKLLDLIEGRE